MKINKYLKISVLFISFTFVGLQFVNAQEKELSPADVLPQDEIVRMQIEAMMTEDVTMMKMSYDKDVEILMYPMVELAKGYDPAIKYWTERFEKNENQGYELLQVINVGNKAIAHARRMVQSETGGGEEQIVIIYSFEKKRIRRVTLIEP